MQGIDFWRLADELTIIQAALLICGYDPTDLQKEVRYDNNRHGKKYPNGYIAIKHALSSAVKSELLPARIAMVVSQRDGEHYPDDDLALIEVQKLKNWLLKKGVRKHFFFFPEEPEGEFLNKSHPRYSSKLAAAVRAWQALEDPKLFTKTPKQSVIKWLRLHSVEYDLCDDDGKPTEGAIAEIAKIVNWNPKGGAPSTPFGGGSAKVTTGSTDTNKTDEAFSVLKEKTITNEFDLDGEIPF